MPREIAIPVLVLLGFAAWTVLILIISVGIYRWFCILTGRASIAEWRADGKQGAEWYQRATRAHMNCIENLPVYGAIVLALAVSGLRSQLIEWLSVTMLVARVGQTTVHVALPLTNVVVSFRFALFSIQLVCMIAMGTIIATAMVG